MENEKEHVLIKRTAISMTIFGLTSLLIASIFNSIPIAYGGGVISGLSIGLLWLSKAKLNWSKSNNNEKLYIGYFDKNENYIGSHGGLYPPEKARELCESMQSNIIDNNYSEYL